MDITKKKVLLIPLEPIDTGNGLTDIHIRREVLDRIHQLNICRVAITYGDYDSGYFVKIKAIEFFVFAYCKIAVSTYHRTEDMTDEILGTLPHNMRKRECLLSIGEKVKGMDYLTMEDFLG